MLRTYQVLTWFYIGILLTWPDKKPVLKAKRLGEGGTQAFGIYFIPYLRKPCQGRCDKS